MNRALVFLFSAAAALAQAPPVIEVWEVPSVNKVRPNEPVQASNLVWDKTSKTISVAGAKNEHVPFQVVISAPLPAKADAPASGFFVEVGDLRSEAGRIRSQDSRLGLRSFPGLKPGQHYTLHVRTTAT